MKVFMNSRPLQTLALVSWLLIACQTAGAVESLSVMSFNVWSSENSAAGRAGIVAAVEAGQADIVGFQEMGGGHGPTIAATLGMNYDAGSGIASAYPIIDSSFSYGVQVELAPGQQAYAFNVHLTHAPYGPYQLASIPYFGGAFYDPDVPSDIDAVVQDQVDARGATLATVLQEMETAVASGLPVFLTGDFNEAPHLDWTAAAKAAGVHNAVVPWPTSIAVQQAGLTDSFREVHPDEVATPGNTWSPVYGPDYINEGVNEPQDRIDLVYYDGVGVSAQASHTVGPDDGISSISVIDFPSDHRAVVSEFSLSSCTLAGDLDGDCSLTAADWQILRANQHADLTSLTAAQAAALGDLNGDFLNNHQDFALFKTSYESSNGAGSFSAMIATVPEPASLGLLILSLSVAVVARSNRR